jgi:hypothetical protein
MMKFLLAHAEPPALDEVCSNICFRLIRRGFPSARTTVLRLEIQENGTAKVFAKIVSGSDTVILDKADSASASDIEEFLSVVKQSDFWRLPSTEALSLVKPLKDVKDGSTWTIEGAQRGNYRLVRRHNPKPQ